MKTWTLYSSHDAANRKEKNLAADAWIAATPDDKYDLCPCGCGLKFRFVERDAKTYEAHRQKFIENWIDKNAPKA